eukprot:4981246-Prymnesium_polylepis.1
MCKVELIFVTFGRFGKQPRGTPGMVGAGLLHTIFAVAGQGGSERRMCCKAYLPQLEALSEAFRR